MIAVTSVDPIRDVVGSNDQRLFDAILKSVEDNLEKEYGPRDELDDEELEEFQERLAETKVELQRMILNAKPPAAEPGCWIFLIKEIIHIKKLQVQITFAFNTGYKHSCVWDPYCKLLRSRLSEPALRAIQHLGNGRPLRGNEIDHDGCIFSWLTQSEISVLHDSLAQIAAPEVRNPDLEEFHRDLVEALMSLKKRQCDVVLGAH